MKNYIVSYGDRQCTISGETLVEAIENHFGAIAGLKPIGNAAGYRLDRVWMEFRDSILGGKGGGVLHILAHGSDSQINYDAVNDPPRETECWIAGVKKEELPECYEFELKETESHPLGPFDDFSNASAGWTFGVIKAIIDEIGDYHCLMKPELSISLHLGTKYPNLALVSPHKYIEAAQKMLIQYRPKTDKATAKLMNRLLELITQFTEQYHNGNKDMSAESISYYKICHYFWLQGKVTALAYYRQKLGKTQQQVADEVGISSRQLQNYENTRFSSLGDAKFTVVAKLADALGVQPSDLVKNGLAVYISQAL